MVKRTILNILFPFSDVSLLTKILLSIRFLSKSFKNHIAEFILQKSGKNLIYLFQLYEGGFLTY